ncbi:MAG: InlB B-repeat-containing protein, partial [Clostridia bacterium]|nr:InlB B-repeat-containing protein [Clostridia bacterium]
MKTFKRALSVMLATVMILTTFFIFDPSGMFPTAEAAVTATDPTYGDLYFVVPEAIYLAPKYNSSTAVTTSHFQWYVNDSLVIDDFDDTVSIGLDKGEASTGKISFLYPDATSVKIAYKWQTEPGQDLIVNGSEATISYGDGNARPVNRNYTLGLTEGYGSTQITWGESPEIPANTTGIWICWIATFTDGADGVEKQAYAYTYLYKPYVAPISVGIRSLNTRSQDHNGSYLSWISGVHGVYGSVKSGSKYANTSGRAFLPFSSSGSGEQAGALNFTLNGYMSLPDDNLGPTHWLSDSQTGVKDATVYYKSSTESSHGSGDDFTITYAYSSTGLLTVDKSRYSNLNQIPNLSVGLMVTDDEDSTSGGAWFLSNFDNHTDKFNTDHTDYWEYKSSNYGYITEYWDPLYNSDKLAFGGNWNDMSAGEGEGLKANVRWRKDISDKSSGTYYIGSGYANQQNEKFLYIGWNTGTDRIFDTSELRCRIEMFDRSVLREAYMYAINSFAANNVQLLGQTSDSWTQFFSLFNAVATWLTKIDCGAYTNTMGYSTPAALANALKNKTNQIRPLSNPDRQTFIAAQYNIKVYDDNGTWKLVTRSGAQTDEYHMGARIDYTAEEYAGYSLKGHVKDYQEATSTYGNATVKQARNITPGEYVVEHATGPVRCSYYYLRDEYTITYDLAGGAMPEGISNPASYNIDSEDITLNAPVRPGFSFEGWTSESDGIWTPTATITIPQGSTGNRAYKAIWGAQTYTVIYHGNGSTGGNTSPSYHTTDVPQTLNGVSFYRSYEISFTYNIWDEWDTDYDTLNYLFDGWNTEPDGSGDAFVNRQSVINLTTGDEFHLYAQWYPQQYVLPTPEKDGFAFDGWYSTPNFTPSSFVGDGGALFTTDHNVDLYAKWAENQYNIIYDGNGATGGSTQKSTHVQGVPKTLTPNGYERKYTVSFDAQGGSVSPVSANAEYEFVSWNTKPDGTGRGFSPDFNVTDIVDVFKDPDTNQPVNTLVLYAQWEVISDTTIALPTPVRPGWTFRGWYEGTVDSDGDVHLTNQVYGTITPTANTVLYATWTAAAFVITFDAKGGQAVPYMAYTTEDTTLLPETTRVGYSFDGWKPRDTEGNWDSGRIYSAGTPVTGRYGSVTLDAQWTAVRYKITFDVNGGDNYPNVFYTIESEDEIGTPTRNGYIFQGWTVTTTDADSNWTESVYAADTLLTGKHGNVTLQAQWLKASYTITFFTDGGNTIPDLEYDTSSTDTLPTPIRTGYTFGGWKPHEASGSWDINTIYVGGTALGGKYGNVRLDAQWTQTQYMISYDERGGTEIPNTIYNVNSLETLPATTRTAYTFDGWKPKTAVGSWNTETVYPSGTNLNGMFGDVTLTAQWTAMQYTITFDPNGAEYYPTPNANTMSYTIESEDELGAPDRPGYEFLGWLVVESEGNWLPAGSTYRSTTIVTRKYGDVTLQAMWEENVYNITYVLTEGASVDPETPNPDTYTYDTPTFTLNNPEKPGYTFAGWTGTGIENGPALTVEVPTHSEGDRSYTATWDVITYTIRYDLANGYEDPEYDPNPTTYTVATPGITLIPPLKDGYDFDGWTGTGVNGKQKIVTIFAGTTGNLMFTAHWKAKDYTISYDLRGGQLPEGVTNPTTYNINIEDDIVLNNPVRSGFTFDGWTGTGLPGKVMTVTILAGSSGNRTYTANWKGIPYDITYDLDGGTMPEGRENPTQYTYDTETFTLYNPVRTGYTFIGWTGSNGETASMAVAIAQGSTGNKSYLAHWDLVTYSISYNLNAGTLGAGVTNPTSYTIESASFTLHNPVRLGHTFAGWTGTELDEATLEVEIPTGSTGNREYTATWVAAQYTITYDLAGGALPEGRVNPDSYGYDTETFTLWSPVKNGYTFAGWTGSNGETPQVGVQIAQGSSGNRSYTANWNAIEYQITYDLVGGSFPIQNPTTYTIETDTFTLHNPERTGYAFIGWSGTGIAEEEVEGRVIIVQGSTGNRSYVAHWDTGETYTITYDYQGGQEDPTKPNRTEYTVNTPTFMLNAPIKTGYTFIGWTGANGGTPELQVYINGNGFVVGNKNYYANWGPNTYYVDYMRNGGAGGENMPSLACTYDPVNPHITLDYCTYTKAGYDFAGWARTSVAETAEFEDGAEIFENLTDSGHIPLYAVWSPQRFNLSFAKGITTPGVVNGSVANIPFLYTEDPDTHEPATVMTLPNGEEDNFFVCYSSTRQV